MHTLRSIPHVDDVQLQNGKLEIRTSNADQVLREILLTDPTANGIELKTYGLEEAFLELTAN
jgi:hypothetical protein